MGGCLGSAKVADEGRRFTTVGIPPNQDNDKSMSRRSTRFSRAGQRLSTVMQRHNTFALISSKKQELRNERSRAGGISEALSRELIKLFEKLDKDGDGELSKNEVKKHLRMLDDSYSTLNSEEQRDRLDAFISSFPGADNGCVSLAMWRKKALTSFEAAPAESEPNQGDWEEQQNEALKYTREIIRIIDSM